MSSQSSKVDGKRHLSTSASTSEVSGSGPITIEIGGHRLTIRSDQEASFVQGLARYINHKLDDLQSAAPTAPMNKLLILASMTVAEELFETREELRRLQLQMKETTESMFELIDQAREI